MIIYYLERQNKIQLIDCDYPIKSSNKMKVELQIIKNPKLLKNLHLPYSLNRYKIIAI